MKRLLLILLVFSITVCCCLGMNYSLDEITYNTSKNTLNKSYTVVIDAGHGGVDAGAIGLDGNNEKDINLAIALMLYDYLMFSGVNSVLIRNGDYEIYNLGEGRNKSDLYNRLDFVNSIENAVLISIHQNKYNDSAEWGSQIWYSPNNAESKIMADTIQQTIVDFLQPSNNRSNKMSDDSYYILYKASVPSIMVECGFVSNKEENVKLQDSDYQGDMAFSIMTGYNGVDFYGKQV